MNTPFEISCRGQSTYKVVVTNMTPQYVEGYVVQTKQGFKVKNHGEFFKRGGGSTSGVNRFYFADAGNGQTVVNKLRKARIRGEACQLTAANVVALLDHLDKRVLEVA